MAVISKNHPLYKKIEELKLLEKINVEDFKSPYTEIPDFFVKNGTLVGSRMLKILEGIYSLPSISLNGFKSNPDALAKIPEEFCNEMSLLPMGVSKTHISLAMADPWDIDTLDYVKMKTGLILEPVIALKSDIEKTAEKLYSTTDALSRAISDIVGDESISAEEKKKKPAFKIEWEDAPVIKLVNYIFQQGISLRASDIHLEPEEKSSSLRYRIDGVLHHFPAPPPEIYKAVVSRIKVLANLDVSESRFPQDGRISFSMGIRTIDFRISVIPFIHGEGVDIRILDKSRIALELKLLGFPQDQYKTYSQAFTSPHGLIIVCGPTGSGKTTTLYATLKIIATPDKKTITIEDPVEYEMNGVQQIRVREDIGFNFEMGLKAILRHDPDIMMIGEMRDLESAEMAIRSALTGHLVLTTLHTNDSVSAITRLIDMGIKDYLVPAVTRMVLSQRLVRKLCTQCKKKVKATKERFEELQLDQASLSELPDTFEIYKEVGCDACKNLGYKGRSGIFEVLDAENLFRHAQIRKMSLQELEDLAIKLGMRPLRASGLKKVIQGITSLEEIMKVTADY